MKPKQEITSEGRRVFGMTPKLTVMDYEWHLKGVSHWSSVLKVERSMVLKYDLSACAVTKAEARLRLLELLKSMSVVRWEIERD